MLSKFNLVENAEALTRSEFVYGLNKDVNLFLCASLYTFSTKTLIYFKMEVCE